MTLLRFSNLATVNTTGFYTLTIPHEFSPAPFTNTLDGTLHFDLYTTTAGNEYHMSIQCTGMNPQEFPYVFSILPGIYVVALTVNPNTVQIMR